MQNQADFVSIDFEHATSKKGTICSVGIVTFKSGEIIDEFHSFVKPPNNEYSPYTIAVHRITPEITINSPNFNEIFLEIRNRIIDKNVVAHGAFHTDKHCLEQAMDFYNIHNDLNIDWICTQAIFNTKLNIACRQYGIELEHHEALSDAKACGQLYNAYLKNEIDFTKFEQNNSFTEQKRRKYNIIYPAQLESEVLKPDFENAENKTSPFYMKKVVISGFNDLDKKTLSNRLKKLGADVDSGIGKSTNFLIIGDNPEPRKIEKMIKNIEDGKDAQIITFEQFRQMIFNSEKI